MLARIARFDRTLLYPLQHRGEQAQADLATIKARDILVQSRTKLVNHVRGSVKSVGTRISRSSNWSFHKKALEDIPGLLMGALLPVIEQIEQLTKTIRQYDRQIEQISKERYPETGCLRQVSGVGPVTALAYVLTLGEPNRFCKSRDVGAFLGLTPKRDQSYLIPGFGQPRCCNSPNWKPSQGASNVEGGGHADVLPVLQVPADKADAAAL